MTENKEILFGGAIQIPKIPEFKPRHSTSSSLLEEAFIQLVSTDENIQAYRDPNKGATLEQVWKMSGILSGKWPVCLLAKGKPSVPINAIERVIKMTPKDLTRVLAEMFRLFDKLAVTTLFHDGNIGHCIILLGYDSNTSRFTYYDPWPGTSLLCAEYNTAGVDAKWEIRGWSVTASELESVIFASFVDQKYWAEYMNEKYCITYDELKNSDFWSFFNITETGSLLQSNNDTLITLRPGGSYYETELMIILNQKMRLVKGELNVKRSWIVGPPYGLNPFGLDIIRSFIVALIPPPDQGKILDLIEMFDKIENRDYTKGLLLEGPNTIMSKALHTYLGLLPSFNLISPFSKITMTNLMLNEVKCLQIEVNIDAL